MGLIPVLLLIIGLALVVTGCVVQFGPFALIASGVALSILAVVVDWERTL
jgi:hypothetical protein